MLLHSWPAAVIGVKPSLGLFGMSNRPAIFRFSGRQGASAHHISLPFLSSTENDAGDLRANDGRGRAAAFVKSLKNTMSASYPIGSG
jgi:hypothetical protein